MTALFNRFPASFAQQRLWFIQQFAPQNAAYNMVLSVPFEPAYTDEQVQSGFATLLACHEGLRTHFEFEGEQVFQVIGRQVQLPVKVLSNTDQALFNSELARMTVTPFDLARSPLIRVLLARFLDGTVTLSLVIHHIVADAQTLAILMEDLERVLCAQSKGLPMPLTVPPFEYADYAVWQRQSMSGAMLGRLTEYWTHRLHALPELRLPLDRERSLSVGSRAGVAPVFIRDETARALRTFAATARTSLFAVLLTGVSILLSRFCAQQNFAVGIPVSGRSRAEFERIAGLFVNSVVYRADVPPELSFSDLVVRTAASMAEDLTHQEMPFDLLIDALGVPRQAERNPLFQVMMQLQRVSQQVSSNRQADERIDSGTSTSQLDLSFILFESCSGPIHGGAIFATELFEQTTIDQLATSLAVLLDDAMANPNTCASALALLDPEQQRRLARLSHGTRQRWPGPQRIDDWFQQIAAERLTATAVESGQASISYQDLDQQSARVATRLKDSGVRPGTVVAIMLPRSIECVSAMLGVLKAGAAYLMLETSTPMARRQIILEDASACLIIEPAEHPPSTEELSVPGLQKLRFSVVTERANTPVPPDSAYVIYTSGSTGQPKGVVIDHASLINHMRWMLHQFDWQVEDRVLQRTPMSFDASVWEFWLPLLRGATLVLAPDQQRFDPARLLAQVQRDRISVLQVVPSLLNELVNSRQAGQDTCLRRIFCGGEALDDKLARRAMTCFSAQLVNLYGLSETTIDSTFHIVDTQHTGSDIPIGRPVSNVITVVLDEHRRCVPQGVVGELYVGGDCVSSGYLNSPELNRNCFVHLPGYPGVRFFRTGDLVRLDCHENLVFVGRRDKQVKLRGFRIEPGDVEQQLRRHPTVVEAVCVVQEHASNDQRLVAFVRLHAGVAPPVIKELFVRLRAHLPAHCVPSAIGILQEFPTTAHGKCDRKALGQMPIECEPGSQASESPRNHVERLICAAFARALGVERVPVDSDFFQIGGHSLLVVSLCSELTRKLTQTVHVIDLFEFPSARLLAKALKHRQAAACESRVTEAGELEEEYR